MSTPDSCDKNKLLPTEKGREQTTMGDDGDPVWFTDEEVTVLRLLASNYTKDEIIVELGVPRDTFLNRYHSILKKTGAQNRWDAVHFAVQKSVIRIV